MPKGHNYTKEYVLAIADLLRQQFNAIDITFNHPKFQSQTADCITYSVYCLPTTNTVRLHSTKRPTSIVGVSATTDNIGNRHNAKRLPCGTGLLIFN